jgi:hypothetical protein
LAVSCCMGFHSFSIMRVKSRQLTRVGTAG